MRQYARCALDILTHRALGCLDSTARGDHLLQRNTLILSRAVANLIDDLGADSLDVVELIMSLEDEFGVSISDEDAAQLYTVGRIVDYLENMK